MPHERDFLREESTTADPYLRGVERCLQRDADGIREIGDADDD